MSERLHEEEQLGAYVDGELDEPTRERVEAHLRTCETCRAELQQLQELQRQMRLSQVPDPGPSYWASFGSRVEQRLPSPVPAAPYHGQRSWLRRGLHWFWPAENLAWRRLAGAAVVVVLVSYVGIRSFSPSIEESGPAVPTVSKQELDRDNLPPSRPDESEIASGPPVSPTTQDEAEEAAAEAQRGRLEEPSLTKEQQKTAPGFASNDISGSAGASTRTAVDRAVEPALQDESTPAPALKRSDAVATTKSASPVKLGEISDVGSPSPSTMELEVHHPEAEKVEQTRRFVMAALAGDVTTARFLREDLRQLSPSDTLVLRHMETWLKTFREARSSAEARTLAAGPAPEGLLALDALVWPHRSEAEWRGPMEEVARRLAQNASRSETTRQRAFAHAQWLAQEAVSEASRAYWRGQLERLQP